MIQATMPAASRANPAGRRIEDNIDRFGGRWRQHEQSRQQAQRGAERCSAEGRIPTGSGDHVDDGEGSNRNQPDGGNGKNAAALNARADAVEAWAEHAFQRVASEPGTYEVREQGARKAAGGSVGKAKHGPNAAAVPAISRITGNATSPPSINAANDIGGGPGAGRRTAVMATWMCLAVEELGRGVKFQASVRPRTIASAVASLTALAAGKIALRPLISKDSSASTGMGRSGSAMRSI